MPPAPFQLSQLAFGSNHLAGHWQRSSWPLAATMGKFAHVVFSKGRPEVVQRIRQLVGESVFKELRWFVANGDSKMYQEAGAISVKETGDLCHTVQQAVDLANDLKRPVTFMADDVRGFYVKMGAPRTWPSNQGQTRTLVQFASRILEAMRQVGAPLGGVYHMSSARTQLLMPYASYHHFCILDFLVFDPPFPLKLICEPQVNCKVDYHLTASTLAAFGAVCRVNHLSIDAPHYQKGGCGTAPQRRKADEAAAKWLQRHWTSQSGEPVFVSNKRRAGNSQVLMCGRGRCLLDQCDPRLEYLHKRLWQAIGPFKFTRAAITKLLAVGSKARSSKARVGSSRELSKKRRTRGTTTSGPRRGAGRLMHGSRPLPMAARQQLSRARAALRKVVLEIRVRKPSRKRD